MAAPFVVGNEFSGGLVSGRRRDSGVVHIRVLRRRVVPPDDNVLDVADLHVQPL